MVDPSTVLAWLFDNENQPRADGVLEHLKEDGASIPQLWHLEIQISLLTAERRGRLSSSDVDERLNALKELPIQTDERPELLSTFDLARRYGLSFYDAPYLELAKRQHAELSTLEGALARASAA